ncbi:MAG: hypothetical protein U0325_35875 [Polyangiales bacterium]
MSDRADDGVDLDDLGLDEGATVLLTRALDARAAGDRVVVRGTHPTLTPHLRAWCRARGDTLVVHDDHTRVIEVGDGARARWVSAVRAEAPSPTRGRPRAAVGPRGARREGRGRGGAL